MLNDAQRESTRAVLEDLFSLWERRASSYGEIAFCSAAARGTDGKWRSVVTFLLPIEREGNQPVSMQADYGHFKVIKDVVCMDRARETLSAMVEKDRLCLPGLPDFELQVSAHLGSAKYYYDSGSRRFPVMFPCYEVNFNVEQGFAGESPQRALCHPDLPLFPSGKEAIAHFFGAQVGDIRSVVSALVPDYRGKIREVRIGANSVAVQVACPAGASTTDLIGKLYCRSQSGVADCADLCFADGYAVAKISDFPRDLFVALLSEKDGDLIDQRQFLAGSIYRSQDVVIEAPEQDLEQVIQMGESEMLEFKRDIPAKKEDIAVAATGFANLRGGTLLIGVGDGCEIVGCRLDKPKDRIAQILRSYCDPPLPVSIEEVSIRDLPIIVITVPEGRDKPYAVKDRGIYIRSGATTRIATRYEVDEMYGSKDNPYGQYGDEFGVS